MKKLIGIFLIFIFTVSLCACSGGISGNEAKTHINGFFKKIESEDYAAAEEFLHPERPAELQVFFETLEDENYVDFSSISIEEYTGFKSSFFDSTVGGSTYSLTMKIAASDKIIQMEIELVKNDNGYGIYNLDIDFD